MSGHKMTAQEVADAIDQEGIGYFLLSYTSADNVQNKRIGQAMIEAEQALNNLNKVVEEECQKEASEQE